jgi:3-oxoacyl-[acyl-carrier protein] reductase
VVATDIDLTRLRQSAAECYWPAERIITAQQDVASPRAWSELAAFVVQKFGAWDVLINIAGVLRVEAVHELKPESIALTLDVNTKGVLLGTQAAAAVMARQGRGHIINMASMAALAPVPGISVYSASKFAVRGFSLAAAQELEPRGVRVSVVYPDAVDTPMVDYQLDHAGAALTFSGNRILTSDEVAKAMVGLLTKPRAELVIPWSRGFLARVSGMMPRWLHRRVIQRLTRKGLATQETLRGKRA